MQALGDAKVVSFRDGQPQANPAEPDMNVVREIEGLLAKARSGEIIGIAWAAHHWDGLGTNHFEGRVSRNTVGNLFSVATRMSLRMDEP